MNENDETMQMSTGLPALDSILHGILPGDNIVWQVNCIDDFLPLVNALVSKVKVTGEKLIYFRFAKHPELVPENSGAEIYQLYPEAGFEIFISKIHDVIGQSGKGVYYVFDSLSELALTHLPQL